ncbi:hypothetical protein [Georhizobium profundi]|nr:hypothetical protein [Georhizobium profundi]
MSDEIGKSDSGQSVIGERDIGKSDEARLIGTTLSGATPKDAGGAVARDATGNTQSPKPDAAMAPKAVSAAERKKERLAAALRDNLRRRKAQMRGRRAMGDGADDSGSS